MSKQRWTDFSFKFSKATLATSSASFEKDEFGYLKEVSTKCNPFPGFIFHIIYHIDRFLHIVGLAKVYLEGLENWSLDISVSKKKKKNNQNILSLQVSEKSTPYKFLAQIYKTYASE